MGTLACIFIAGLQSCGVGDELNHAPGATVKKSFSLLADKKYEKGA